MRCGCVIGIPVEFDEKRQFGGHGVERARTCQATSLASHPVERQAARRRRAPCPKPHRLATAAIRSSEGRFSNGHAMGARHAACCAHRWNAVPKSVAQSMSCRKSSHKSPPEGVIGIDGFGARACRRGNHFAKHGIGFFGKSGIARRIRNARNRAELHLPGSFRRNRRNADAPLLRSSRIIHVGKPFSTGALA